MAADLPSATPVSSNEGCNQHLSVSAWSKDGRTSERAWTMDLKLWIRNAKPTKKTSKKGEKEKRRKETLKRCNKHRKRNECKRSTFTQVLYFISPQNSFPLVPLVECAISKISMLHPPIKTGSKLKNLWYLYFTWVFTFYVSFTTSQRQLLYLLYLLYFSDKNLSTPFCPVKALYRPMCWNWKYVMHWRMKDVGWRMKTSCMGWENLPPLANFFKKHLRSAGKFCVTRLKTGCLSERVNSLKVVLVLLFKLRIWILLLPMSSSFQSEPQQTESGLLE